MPSPVALTAPFDPWLKPATAFGPPSASVSLSRTSIATATSSDVVCASSTATGGASVSDMVITKVRCVASAPPFAVPPSSLAVTVTVA